MLAVRSGDLKLIADLSLLNAVVEYEKAGLDLFLRSSQAIGTTIAITRWPAILLKSELLWTGHRELQECIFPDQPFAQKKAGQN
jgi:hypothetical protein